MSGSALEILQCAYASIQDAGRVGAEHWGVARAGFADARHGQLANALCGNALDVAAIEIFVGRFVARFREDCCFATAGANVSLTLDDKPIAVGAKVLARAGSVLKLGRSWHGRILYLALPGGVLVEPVMGSRSTDLNAGFGGMHGRILKAGDSIFCRVLDTHPPRSRAFLASLSGSPVLRYVPWLKAPSDSSERFAQTIWRIHPQSQRAGVRLIGEPLAPIADDGISRAVVPGVIQLPPNGLPIILGVDAQTIGGYPVLGTLIAADLWRLAQLSPAEAVRFEVCNLAQAQQIGALQYAEFQRSLIGIERSYGPAGTR